MKIKVMVLVSSIFKNTNECFPVPQPQNQTFKLSFPTRNYINDLMFSYTTKRARKLTLAIFLLPIESTERVV